MYAIMNTKTNKWVYGTDYRYNPPRQRTSFEEALTFEELEDAQYNFKLRHCGKKYKIYRVHLAIIHEEDK